MKQFFKSEIQELDKNIKSIQFLKEELHTKKAWNLNWDLDEIYDLQILSCNFQIQTAFLLKNTLVFINQSLN